MPKSVTALPSAVSLQTVTPPDPAALRLHCVNCALAVTGRFCSACGERAEYDKGSLRDAAVAAAGLLIRADSIFWRTLVALLLRPGFLTQQFLAGRRKRYLSPFKLYVVISVLFFLVVGFDRQSTPRSDVEQVCAASIGPLVNSNWMRHLRLIACASTHADHGRELEQDFIRNLGRAMFLFLPLLAAFMKVMYWRPRRSFMTHLVLQAHNHAFVFLLMSAVLATLQWVHGGTVTAILTGLLAFYAICYLYRSLRCVYGQSRWLTLLKLATLSVGYLGCALSTLFLTGVYSVQIL